MPSRTVSGKRRFYRSGRLAPVKPVHGLVGIVHRNAGRREHRCRRRLPHADRAGEAKHDHDVCNRSATISSRNSPVTSGRRPNQRSKPGTA